MEFEWDENKSLSNKQKHGIDFASATELWNDTGGVEIQTTFRDESRNILIGKIRGRLWAAVFTLRDSAVRIISVRKAREREAELYEQKNENR